MKPAGNRKPLALNGLLDWLYPPICVGCRMIIALNLTQPRYMGMCAMCQSLFAPIEGPTCKNCGVPTEREVNRCVSCFGKTFHFTQNRATFAYAEIVRDLLLELKFNQDKQIAHSLGKVWAICAPKIEDCILVPLPLHRKKQRERGFNQAEILARYLGERFNIPVENVVERVIDTPPQSGLHPRQRMENIEGAFAIAKNADVQGNKYIVIDDIYTTGASLNECARVLMVAGAVSVSSMTLCVVEKKDEDAKKNSHR